MILTRLAAVVTVLMALAVPCTRGALMVLDARRRGGSPTHQPATDREHALRRAARAERQGLAA